MTRAPIQRGTCVYDIADPRHYGIVRSLHLVKGKFFANVHWIETGWHSYRVPVINLRRVAHKAPDITECDVMRRALRKESK